MRVPVPRSSIIGRTNLSPPCRAGRQNGCDIRASSLPSRRKKTSTPCLWRLIMQDCQACNVPISRTTGDRLLSNTFSSLRSSVVSHVGLGGRFQGKTQRTLFVSPIISRSGCQSESIREKVGESRCHCTVTHPPSTGFFCLRGCSYRASFSRKCRDSFGRMLQE